MLPWERVSVRAYIACEGVERGRMGYMSLGCRARGETASRFGPGPWCRETPPDWSFYIERPASWAPPNGPTSSVIFYIQRRANVTRWSCETAQRLCLMTWPSGRGDGNPPIWRGVPDWEWVCRGSLGTRELLKPAFCPGGFVRMASI